MVEYVYALHDFLPEHDDEVEFHAGERIEVVEKDDLYGDGWWQVRIYPPHIISSSFATSKPIQVLALERRSVISSGELLPALLSLSY